MAVGKDLLQLDLYGLLGVGEKASEKEVLTGTSKLLAAPVIARLPASRAPPAEPECSVFTQPDQETKVLVAPITDKGQTWRDIYLPGEGHLWMDTNTARVFDGGTVLRNYSAGLAEVPVVVKTS